MCKHLQIVVVGILIFTLFSLFAQAQVPSEPYPIYNTNRANPFKVILKRYISADNFLRPGANLRSSKNIKDAMPARAVKLNLTALAVGNITIGYERDIADHLSVTVQVRYTLPQKPLGAIGQSTEDIFSFSDSIYASAPTLKGYALTLGMRYYPRHTLKGFYLEPYLRYRKNAVELPISYYNDASILTATNLNGDMNAGIMGLALGFHFDIKRRISLDLMVGGIQYGYNSGNLLFETSEAQFFSANDQNEINQGLEDFKNNNPIDYNYEVTGQKIDIDASFSSLGIRFGSLSLGYRF